MRSRGGPLEGGWPPPPAGRSASGDKGEAAAAGRGGGGGRATKKRARGPRLPALSTCAYPRPGAVSQEDLGKGCSAAGL